MSENNYCLSDHIQKWSKCLGTEKNNNIGYSVRLKKFIVIYLKKASMKKLNLCISMKKLATPKIGLQLDL